MQTLGKLLAPLSLAPAAVQDTVKLVVIGGTVETARRVSSSAWNSFVDSFFLTAHFSQDDVPYDWLMHWLARQPAYSKAREFEITTRQGGGAGIGSGTAGDIEEDDDEDGGFVHGKKKKRVVFMPCQDTTHNIYYAGHPLRITRSRRNGEYGPTNELKISVVARNNNVIKRLVLEAKKQYEADAEHRVHIFFADHYGYWRWNGARQKRPLSSIVLEPGVKDMIVADCKDFLRSEDWYAERGIPYRRGYLLHGVPGSGKTSLIHALAGELGLDIYVVSLSMKGMNDNMLMNLMSRIPSRCILLLEDLDAAFTRSVTRDASSTGTPVPTRASGSSRRRALTPPEDSNDASSLSLSGLLNALDGVAASEGRLLFATTNHIERLDPALSRPGRMDVWINFKNATKWQAEGIFKCFFPTVSSPSATPTTEADTKSETDKEGTQQSAQSHRKQHTQGVPLLSAEELETLAKKFAEAIPGDEMSVASLQGYLLKNKTRPRECVEEVHEWVKTERETREKLKKEKEKEEREAKETKEADEAKAKKGKEEAETKVSEADKDTEEDAATPASTSTTIPPVPPRLPITTTALKTEVATSTAVATTTENQTSVPTSLETTTAPSQSDSETDESETSETEKATNSTNWLHVKSRGVVGSTSTTIPDAEA